MKRQTALILGLAFCLCGRVSLGHDQPVHFAITLNAAASAYDDSTDFVAFLNIVSPDLAFEDATNFMAAGSFNAALSDFQ